MVTCDLLLGVLLPVATWWTPPSLHSSLLFLLLLSTDRPTNKPTDRAQSCTASQGRKLPLPPAPPPAVAITATAFLATPSPPLPTLIFVSSLIFLRQSVKSYLKAVNMEKKTHKNFMTECGSERGHTQVKTKLTKACPLLIARWEKLHAAGACVGQRRVLRHGPISMTQERCFEERSKSGETPTHSTNH